MKKLIIGSIALSLLNGCASLDKWTDFEDQQVEASINSGASQTETNKISLLRSADPLENSANFQNQYQDKWSSSSNGQMGSHNGQAANTKNVNHYVRGIMQDLLTNLQYVNASTPMAVSSFVFLDSNYQSASLLGNQISEGFMHEVHKLGIPVVDFKATDYIRVTPGGDFVLSKDYIDLSPDIPIRYVLTGTLVRHQQGIMVNARIVGMESKAIVASAQGFIHSAISNHIMKSNNNDGIPVYTAQ
jgi:TolB-like protein